MILSSSSQAFHCVSTLKPFAAFGPTRPKNGKQNIIPFNCIPLVVTVPVSLPVVIVPAPPASPAADGCAVRAGGAAAVHRPIAVALVVLLRVAAGPLEPVIGEPVKQNLKHLSTGVPEGGSHFLSGRGSQGGLVIRGGGATSLSP